MEMTTDNDVAPDTMMPSSGPDASATSTATPPKDAELVKKLIKEVKSDKRFFEKAFERMQRDMMLATYGRDKTWSEKKYTANIIGRHVKQKTATLYAKNPRVKASRRETLDFQIWDESEQSLLIAMQTVDAAMQAMAANQAALAGPPVIDGATGAPIPPQQMPIPPGVEEAQALIADFQQGMERRKMMKKFGRTLEVLFTQAMKEQKPLDFKIAMKKVVRRACTTGVGYVKLGFQRETGPSPVSTAKLNDARDRIAHLQKLMENASEYDAADNLAEIAELEKAIIAFQSEPEILLREGLIFDYPQSTKVIPSRHTTSLVGFVGAPHVTIEYIYPKERAEELFGVKLGDNYTPYVIKDSDKEPFDDDQTEIRSDGMPCKDQMVCVWEIFDKESGLVYYVCDGHDGFLREPAAPDVFVNDFWPIYALTFNDVENEKEIFPPSDATLLRDQQLEVNRSRQAKRDHRKAAQPRWIMANASIDKVDVENLRRAEPFDVIPINKDPDKKVGDMLEVAPVPGVDPNLYDTNEVMADFGLIGGGQSATMGGMAKATATANAIAAQGASTEDNSGIDDLDNFMTQLTRAASQILMREMSVEKVMEVAGPGAVWPDQSLAQIADEIWLDIEAGSTGKPNQAVEINNWKEMLPFLIQMGSIPSTWLARESLRRLDDRMDLTEAVVEGVPAIVAQNRAAQGMGASGQDPNDQGAQGGDNAEKGQEGTAGGDAQMGDANTQPKVTRYGANGQRMA